jgi:hypothetical protein
MISDLVGLDQAQLRDALLTRHPWYDEMICNADEWPLMRAVTGALAADAVKRDYLPKGDFEPEEQYSTRVELSQFAGKTTGIAASFAGAVFSHEPTITMSGAPDLAAWSENVDGNGSTIFDLLEVNSDESIPMGAVAFFVDMPAMTPEQSQGLAAVKPEEKNADGLPPLDILKKLGIKRAPRIARMCVENVQNWQPDDQGRLSWVILVHEVTRQEKAAEDRVTRVQWICSDRMMTAIFEADYGTPTESGEVMPERVVLPIDEHKIGPIKFIRSETHGLNVVPLAIYYGGGRRYGTLESRSLLEGTKRSDLAGFNQASWLTFAMYLHNVPMLVLKTTRDVDEIVRDISRALVLNPDKDEDAEYKSTPHESFEMSMKAIESHALEAFRQAGADPSGMFEGSTSAPESGKAKSLRFANTEARSLSRIARDTEAAHFDLLEIGARYLSPVRPSIDERAFTGTVEYVDPAKAAREQAEQDREAQLAALAGKAGGKGEKKDGDAKKKLPTEAK